ncbi:hypothetical protein WJX73_005509 [Symbiochloris irregularis]|uniref:Kelch repeat-containing protein n=1 Tax=Symbiochloris irregularis TaxID=706552 RepID=A0AAW1P3T7_9CHLO
MASDRQTQEPLLPSQQPAQAEQGSAPEQEGDEAEHPLSHRLTGARLLIVSTAVLLLLVACTFGLTYSYAANRYFLSTAPPTCRKSAAAVISSGLRLGEDEGSPRLKGKQLLVWSGKGHHADLMFDDLRAFDLRTGGWHRLYDRTDNPNNKARDPIGRWKAVAVFDESLPGLVISGGDAASDGSESRKQKLPNKGFLNDIWWLPTNVSLPFWEQPALGSTPALEADKHKHVVPSPRRAHAGSIFASPDRPTQLVIHGGKAPKGDELADVWTAHLTSAAFRWERLYEPLNESEAGISYPAPRKGHIAVTIPGDDPLLFIWGGRNDTAYFGNAPWVFSLQSRQWTHWLPSNPSSPSPGSRDHLGAFYYNGRVYIYGGRGGKDYVSSKPLNDIWAFDVAARTWSPVVTRGATPTARFLYSMAFYTTGNDTTRGQASEDGRMVIFGGEGRDGCFYNDVHEFSLAASKWRELSANRPCQKRCRGKHHHKSLRDHVWEDNELSAVDPFEEEPVRDQRSGANESWVPETSVLELGITEMRQVLRQV